MPVSSTGLVPRSIKTHRYAGSCEDLIGTRDLAASFAARSFKSYARAGLSASKEKMVNEQPIAVTANRTRLRCGRGRGALSLQVRLRYNRYLGCGVEDRTSLYIRVHPVVVKTGRRDELTAAAENNLDVACAH